MINTVTGVGGVALVPNQLFSRGLAAGITGEMGARAAAWVTQLSGHGAKDGVGFQPDPALLSRGGDIYGIADVTREVAGRLGATAAEEGALYRSIEDYTREAVVAAANASDTATAVATSSVEAEATQVDTIDSLIAQLEQATAALRK